MFMERIETDDDLQAAIKLLENRKENDLRLLKKEMHNVIEALKPVNLIKSTLKEVTSSPEIRSNLLNTAIGMGTGFVAKKLFIGGSGVISRLLGSLVQRVVSLKVTKNADGIKSAGKNIIKKLFSRSEPVEETS